MIRSIEMTRSEIDAIKDEIIKHVMENDPDYEAEYAGRMERWCFYCGAYHEPRKGITHDKNCVWIKSQILKEMT